ncbi:hypothetical protein F4779DRAFT_590470 [Xylariaceae sp. FL0662B]|nr:hypothetical protein F4779DRAFT_590470 [Xylariaceae sp. FL0662B]
MCLISRVDCKGCNAKDRVGFCPCDDVLAQSFDADTSSADNSPLRIYCPKFVWPTERKTTVHNCTKNKKATKNRTQLQILNDISYRQLTLWIPFCNLCKQPRFAMHDDDTAEEEGVDGGIEDIELEPNLLLQKEIRDRYQSGRLCGVETHIATGFINKPCETCINLETVLRGKVIRFIEQCDPVKAWAVWNWLLLRGTGRVDFWNHELKDTGIPDTKPPHRLLFRSMMSDGWKAITGVAWEDICDFGPPAEIPLSLTVHKLPFTDLWQWNGLAGIRGKPDPVVEAPPSPPSLDDGPQVNGSPTKESSLNVDLEANPSMKKQTSVVLKSSQRQEKSDTEATSRGPKDCHSSPTSSQSSFVASRNAKRRLSSDDDHPHKRIRFNISPRSSRSTDVASIANSNSVESEQDTSDLFGDKIIAAQTSTSATGKAITNGLASPSPDGVEQDNNIEDTNSDASQIHIGAGSDTEMGDAQSVNPDGHANLKLCDRGCWHLGSGRDADTLWHLPLGVKLDEDEQ